MGHSRKEPVRPSPTTLGLPPCGADTHAHLGRPTSADELDISSDVGGVLERAGDAGVSLVGQIFLHPERYYAERAWFDNAPIDVFFAMAIHPMEGRSATEETMSRVRRAFLEDDRLRAVGETGLDHYWKECCPEDIQEEVFRRHVALAREVGRPLMIHSRDAATDSIRILEDEGAAGRPLLWHCFSGDAIGHLDRILANGWHVAVGGALTYPANQALRDALHHIPADRLMLETDAPYLAPVPWRGKPNEPALAAFTCVRAAEVLGVDPADLWRYCGNNARTFFDMERNHDDREQYA